MGKALAGENAAQSDERAGREIPAPFLGGLRQEKCFWVYVPVALRVPQRMEGRRALAVRGRVPWVL